MASKLAPKQSAVGEWHGVCGKDRRAQCKFARDHGQLNAYSFRNNSGRTYPDRKRKIPEANHESKLGKIKAQEYRKAEITERTRRGESAEQIAAFCE